MTEQGIVISSKDNFAEVRIERNSACGKCGKCGMSEKQKHVDFFVENVVDAQVGDVVELDIPEANTARLALVAYILPLIPALLLMLMSILLSWHEGFSILLFFAGLAIGFVIVALIDRRRKHKWAKSPKLTAIVKTYTKKESIENE